jgi:hypothetical protein
VTYSLDLVLRIYDGVFALFLGLSFARTSRAFFQYALPMFLVMPLAVLAMPFPDASSKMFFSASLGMFFVPICYWSASVICLLQAAYLKLHHGNHFRPVRRNRLLFFGMTLAVLGTVTYLRASGLASPNQFEVASRFIPLALVLLLGGVVVLEYSETEKAVRVSHLSKYHKRPILPTRVPGVMLKIDLKESTVLEKEAGARSGAQEYGKLSTVWFSMMAQVVFEFGGEIIKEEGDSLIAFFDSESQKNPLLSAVWAAQKMSSSQAGLSQVFEMLGLDPKRRVCFRGAIVSGDLFPVWKNSGPFKVPSFEGNVLVNASRLLDLEYEIPENKGKTLIVLEDSDFDAAEKFNPGFSEQLLLRHHRLTDSDQKPRIISVLHLIPDASSIQKSA